MCENDRFLAYKHRLPKALLDSGPVAAFIYDDTMVFDCDRERGDALMSKLDKVFSEEGAAVATEKGLHGVLNGKACGVELFEGHKLTTNITKLKSLWLDIVAALELGRAFPSQVEAWCGTMHWFDLLVRPKLSVYHEIYRFHPRNVNNVDTDMPFWLTG